MPIAATSHSVAAVVKPRTESPWRMIAPAPRKPMPVTIWAAIRVGSARITWSPLVRNSRNPYAETIVKSADPIATSMCVRSPASRSRSSRSNPIAPPRAAAVASRPRTLQSEIDGTSARRRIHGLPLGGSDLLDAGRREVDELVQLGARERHLLGRRLHLDQPAVARHHDVEVDVRRRVLAVIEVEQGLRLDDPDGHRADR